MSIAATLAHPDPVVAQAVDIWLPRFLRGGLAIGDIVATLTRIGDWSDWQGEWEATARVHEERAVEASRQGWEQEETAAWEDAARCYHLSYFLSVDDEAAHRRGLESMVRCHERALRGMQPVVEKVEIAGGGLRMVGLLSVPAPGAPLVILIPGLDSTKETRHFGRRRWTGRGVAVLSLDGPGQGEASMWSTASPDYERAISAAIDWAESREDIDASRVGLVGSSLGGYYAPRAAALEPRVTATIANCGPYDWGACWDGLPIVTRKAFAHYSGAADMDTARLFAREFNLSGLLGGLTSPLYVVHGSEDPLIPWQQGRQIADEAPGEVVFDLVEGGNHGVNNLSYRWAGRATEWMLAHLEAAG